MLLASCFLQLNCPLLASASLLFACYFLLQVLGNCEVCEGTGRLKHVAFELRKGIGSAYKQIPEDQKHLLGPPLEVAPTNAANVRRRQAARGTSKSVIISYDPTATRKLG